MDSLDDWFEEMKRDARAEDLRKRLAAAKKRNPKRKNPDSLGQFLESNVRGDFMDGNREFSIRGDLYKTPRGWTLTDKHEGGNRVFPLADRTVELSRAGEDEPFLIVGPNGPRKNPDSWVVVREKGQVFDPMGYDSTLGPFASKKKARAKAKSTGGKLMGKREHQRWHGQGRSEIVSYLGGRPRSSAPSGPVFALIKVGTNERKHFRDAEAVQRWLENHTYGRQFVDETGHRWRLGSDPGYGDEREYTRHGRHWEPVWVLDNKPRLP